MVNGPRVNACNGCGGVFLAPQRSNHDYKLCDECLYTDDLVESRWQDGKDTPSHLDTLAPSAIAPEPGMQ